MSMPLVPPSLSRLFAGLALLGAFLVMASVFAPHRIEAQDASHWPKPIELDWEAHRAQSTDPHEGLPLLGTLEYARHIVRIYSTEVGARYSVYEITDEEGERELGVLLSAEQMGRHFPELPLRNIESPESRQFMLAQPRREFE